MSSFTTQHQQTPGEGGGATAEELQHAGNRQGGDETLAAASKEGPKRVGVTQGKGRSLADMLEQQIKDGTIDMESDAKYEYSGGNSIISQRDRGGRYNGSSSSNRNYDNRRQGGYRNNRGQWQHSNPPGYYQDGYDNESSLNWQQQSLMANNHQPTPWEDGGAGGRRHHTNYQNSDARYNDNGPSNYQQQYNPNRQSHGGHQQPYHDNRDNRQAPYQSQYNNGGGGRPQYQQQQVFGRGGRRGNQNYRNNSYGGNFQRGGGFNYQNQQQQQQVGRKSDYDNFPEWADDLTSAGGGGSVENPDESSLNWQQQSLMNRDDNDPFLTLVRGENELARE